MVQQGIRIVILGAGFGGIAVARGLVRLLPRSSGYSITLVDRNNYFLFTPMLTEVAAGELDVRHIASPVRQLSLRVRFEQGCVQHVDVQSRRVTLQLDGPGGGPKCKVLEADQLVLALGSVTSYHHIPGVAEHAFTMKSLSDAAALRSHAALLLERADAEDDPAHRGVLLRFVIGGGGFSGVETAAALNDYLRSNLHYYPRLRNRDVRVLLVAPEPRLLPELSASLAAYAQRRLEQRGIQVLLQTSIAEAGADFVQLKEGARVPTYTLIWTAGVQAPPVVEALDCKKGSEGRVVVDQTCALPDFPTVWALGDCAEIPGDVGGKPYGPTAQNATREGDRVAENIAASVAGRPLQPFRYHPIGEVAIVGRHTGVAQLYGLKFSGLAAWALWRAVYLFKLPGLGTKVRVGLDWALDLMFGRDLTALPLESRQHEDDRTEEHVR